jgi:uncharacterized protein (TIGR03437 family)
MVSLRKFSAIAGILSAFTCLAGAAPALSAVYNGASWVTAGLPNSSIAEGSIFTITGTGIGPSTLTQVTSYPLPTSQGIGGTTVQVTVAGSTSYCIMVYAISTQVAAILPSATPVGSGTLTVTYNNASANIPIQVVKNSVGIFTVNQAGSGPGVITNLDYHVAVPNNAVHPGDILILWGTGLGPVTGDETEPPTPVDLGTGVEIFVGGQQATVLYGGRGSSPGLDQINFTVPAGLGGCYVSVFAQVNGVVSNFVTIPIAAAGQSFCTDETIGISAATVSKAASGGTINVGIMYLDNVEAANGKATFHKWTYTDLISTRGPFGGPSPGSCTVYVVDSGGGIILTDPFTTPGLNAGSSVSVSGPAGSQNMPDVLLGSYEALFSGASFLTPGSYTIGNGAGGTDIGAFSTAITYPQPLTWTNQSSITSVSASNDLTITWSGGGPNDYVSIFGVSGLASNQKDTQFFCTASASAGQFTVPSQVFALLPPKGLGSNLQPGTNMYVALITPANFTAPNLDYGFMYTSETILSYLKITP